MLSIKNIIKEKISNIKKGCGEGNKEDINLVLLYKDREYILKFLP